MTRTPAVPIPGQAANGGPNYLPPLGARSLDRGTLFAGLVIVGFANGISHRVIAAVREDAGRALLHTFDIGAIAWIALFTCIFMLARRSGRVATRADLVVAGLAFMTFLAPAAPLSWLGLTGIGAYIAITSPARSPSRRAAYILFALTVPMFWSRVLFTLMSDSILGIDAMLVSWVLGTPRVGNSIAFADGWGYFWIAAPCSSLANVSLAVLCWVLVTQTLDRGHVSGLRYCILACSAVVVLNVGRLALTGISRGAYEVVHGPAGSFLVAWLIFGVTLAICLYGATREPRHAALASS
jgi:hypothetical protein